MDAKRFDALVQTFPSRASRRGLIAGLASGSFSVLLPRPANDAAAKKKHKKKCKGGKQKCGGKCRPKCPAGQTRNPSTCGCCLKGGSACGSQLEAECCLGFCLPTQAGLFCSQ